MALDDQFPFHVFGASQDEGAYEGASAAVGPGIGPDQWHVVALGDSTFVAPEPGDPFVTYGSGYFSAFVSLNRITGDTKNVSPWPRYMSGAAGGGNEISLRLDASDLLLTGRSARAARRIAGRLLEHGPRPDVEHPQSRSHAQ